MVKRNNNIIQKKKLDKEKRFKYFFVLSMLVSVISTLTFMNSVYAESINSANIYVVGDCGSLLTYNSVPVKVTYVEYNHNGISYPAYCLDKTKARCRNNTICSISSKYGTRCRIVEKNY